ncbi:hypothetical protein SAMN05444320_1129 [Streptoalloteichus hindustanus]|uniref:Uncharacterized protein n=1 Tax=Streptoalloteichus hindustanus TaxID=2017 RepID=A0A1M5LPL5_STRHI|nr:hypothetical protein SAMN05444320_1129 [Streptoalloteichus hindustanus]
MLLGTHDGGAHHHSRSISSHAAPDERPGQRRVGPHPPCPDAAGEFSGPPVSGSSLRWSDFCPRSLSGRRLPGASSGRSMGCRSPPRPTRTPESRRCRPRQHHRPRPIPRARRPGGSSCSPARETAAKMIIWLTAPRRPSHRPTRIGTGDPARSNRVLLGTHDGGVRHRLPLHLPHRPAGAPLARVHAARPAAWASCAVLGDVVPSMSTRTPHSCRTLSATSSGQPLHDDRPQGASRRSCSIVLTSRDDQQHRCPDQDGGWVHLGGWGARVSAFAGTAIGRSQDRIPASSGGYTAPGAHGRTRSRTPPAPATTGSAHGRRRGPALHRVARCGPILTATIRRGRPQAAGDPIR